MINLTIALVGIYVGGLIIINWLRRQSERAERKRCAEILNDNVKNWHTWPEVPSSEVNMYFYPTQDQIALGAKPYGIIFSRDGVTLNAKNIKVRIREEPYEDPVELEANRMAGGGW